MVKWWEQISHLGMSQLVGHNQKIYTQGFSPVMSDTQILATTNAIVPRFLTVFVERLCNGDFAKTSFLQIQLQVVKPTIERSKRSGQPLDRQVLLELWWSQYCVRSVRHKMSELGMILTFYFIKKRAFHRHAFPIQRFLLKGAVQTSYPIDKNYKSSP